MPMIQIARPKHFSERESLLFSAWMQTLDEVNHREGPLHFMGDAMPILAMLTREHFPKISPRRAANIGFKLIDFYVQAHKAMHSEPAGRA